MIDAPAMAACAMASSVNPTDSSGVAGNRILPSAIRTVLIRYFNFIACAIPAFPPAAAKCKLSLMVFTKRLREGVRRGEITCSVRIWTRPHVKVGARYRMDEGEIEVDSITPIGFPDITPELARESGFLGLIDLLKVAKHGKGENIYLIRFHYLRPRPQRQARR